MTLGCPCDRVAGALECPKLRFQVLRDTEKVRSRALGFIHLFRRGAENQVVVVFPDLLYVVVF